MALNETDRQAIHDAITSDGHVGIVTTLAVRMTVQCLRVRRARHAFEVDTGSLTRAQCLAAIIASARGERRLP